MSTTNDIVKEFRDLLKETVTFEKSLIYLRPPEEDDPVPNVNSETLYLYMNQFVPEESGYHSHIFGAFKIALVVKMVGKGKAYNPSEDEREIIYNKKLEYFDVLRKIHKEFPRDTTDAYDVAMVELTPDFETDKDKEKGVSSMMMIYDFHTVLRYDDVS